MLLKSIFLIVIVTLVAVRIVHVNSIVDNYGEISVIDVTMFNGEPMGIYRLFYLKDYVDYFFVVESLETFSGNLKSSYDIDNYVNIIEPIKSKVIILKLDRLPIDNKTANFRSHTNHSGTNPDEFNLR